MCTLCTLGISEFINRSTQAACKFESLVNQIQKNERDIDTKLRSIEMANLFKFPAPDKSNELPGTIRMNLNKNIRIYYFQYSHLPLCIVTVSRCERLL